MREAQEAAIVPILEGAEDVIIAASTASGKTEAALLPICSKLIEDDTKSRTVLYIGPLKALINDQFDRMEQLCSRLDISVHPWHGDIDASTKKKFLKKPQGILLITPESLESLFVNHGHDVPRLFNELAYIVADELHSFMGTERGRQLQSLLHRVELAIKRRIPRIGLSATLGDMKLASNFLRPDGSDNVRLIVSTSAGQEVRLMIHGHIHKPPQSRSVEADDATSTESPEEDDGSFLEISSKLFNTLRGSINLIFSNSRNRVERYADKLRRLCEERRFPNEFYPHHGSLSKQLREDAEAIVKDKTRPASIVCTSTLEMGIDIGIVKSIAQIGSSPSVSSMRQRLGRSGRRGEPAIMRIYVEEVKIDNAKNLNDLLRTELVQNIAMVNLLINKWCEPSGQNELHLSTMIHQVLSIIAERGGVTAAQAWRILCVEGPFISVSQEMFLDLLRGMGSSGLIVQQSDGLLLAGTKGEKIINHYSFYAVFFTPEEFRLVCSGQSIGTLPVSKPLQEGAYLIFGGKRWLVVRIDDDRKLIELSPAKGGKAPLFDGQAVMVHDAIREEMRRVYKSTDIPPFIDSISKSLLAEARDNFMRFNLGDKYIVDHDGDAYLFCWHGNKVTDTIVTLLRKHGLRVSSEGATIIALKTSAKEMMAHIYSLANSTPLSAAEIADFVENKLIDKFDCYLPNHLLNADYASSRLDFESTWKVLREIASAT